MELFASIYFTTYGSTQTYHIILRKIIKEYGIFSLLVDNLRCVTIY